jgi:hypothetical protein
LKEISINLTHSYFVLPLEAKQSEIHTIKDEYISKNHIGVEQVWKDSEKLWYTILQ